jgi:protoporphyrinogen/coproporphyrinogen III oxidase
MAEHTRNSSRRVAVIGGGMAGCAAARELLRAGREVTIIESSGALGGRARSWHRPEITPDVGINLWFTNGYKVMFERIKEYGLTDSLITMSNNVIVVDDGKAAEITSDSTKTLLTYPHVSVFGRVRFLTSALRETLRRRKLDLFEPEQLAKYDKGTTGAEYARKWLGQRTLDNLLRPEIESFWLWRVEEISAAHIMAMNANVVGAKFYCFKQGMEVVAEHNARGAELKLDCEATEVAVNDGVTRVTYRDAAGETHSDEFGAVVVATTAPVADKLTASLPTDVVPADARRFIETQVYEPALSISFIVERSQMPSEAHIVPTGDGPHPVRTIITFPREMADENGVVREKELVFVYPGREETRRLIDAPPEKQYARVKEIIGGLWPKFPADALPFEIAIRPTGMPLPAPGRFIQSARIAKAQRGPVVLAGDYFCSPTAEAAMRSGIRAANALLGTASR